jgi:hypothetical protein
MAGLGNPRQQGEPMLEFHALLAEYEKAFLEYLFAEQQGEQE